jgi:hypothetical protein
MDPIFTLLWFRFASKEELSPAVRTPKEPIAVFYDKASGSG